MQMFRGIHELDPLEFPPSPDWKKSLPVTSINIELIDEEKLYVYPGDDFLEYYVKEVGYLPPRDWVVHVLRGGDFPYVEGIGIKGEMEGIYLGFLRKNARGVIVNTMGSDSNISIGRPVVLQTLPKPIEAEFLNRLRLINHSHRQFQSLELAPSPEIQLLDDFSYPLSKAFADPLWELGACFTKKFEWYRSLWVEEDGANRTYPAAIVLCAEEPTARLLQSEIQPLLTDDPYLTDISHELTGKTEKNGIALYTTHTDPTYLDEWLTKQVLFMRKKGLRDNIERES